MPEPKIRNTLLQDAIALHNRGLMPEAQQHSEAILAVDAQDADALHLLGVSYFQQGLPDLAIPLIWSSLQHNPLNSLAYSNLGNAFQAKSSFQEAIDCYDAALGLDPLHADAFFNRGMAAFLAAGHSDEARRMIHTVRGVAGAVGATPLQKIAAELEGEIYAGRLAELDDLLAVLKRELVVVLGEVDCELAAQCLAGPVNL